MINTEKIKLGIAQFNSDLLDSKKSKMNTPTQINGNKFVVFMTRKKRYATGDELVAKRIIVARYIEMPRKPK